MSKWVGAPFVEIVWMCLWNTCPCLQIGLERYWPSHIPLNRLIHSSYVGAFNGYPTHFQ